MISSLLLLVWVFCRDDDDDDDDSDISAAACHDEDDGNNGGGDAVCFRLLPAGLYAQVSAVVGVGESDSHQTTDRHDM